MEVNMPVDVFELKWKCCHCPEIMLGRHEKCKMCGHPKCDSCSEIDTPDLGPGRGIKDPELLEKFEAGADWVCKYCQSHERKDTGACANCGASESQGTSRDEREEAPAKPRRSTYRTPPPPERVETYPPPVINRYKPTDEPFDYEGEAKKLRSYPWELVKPYVFVGLIAVFALCGAWAVFHTRVLDVGVQSVSWNHTVIVDRYAVYHRDGFEETEPSTAFNVQPNGQRVHHYDHVIDHYESRDHTRQVSDGQDCHTSQHCYTTSRTCTSGRNGSKTCSGGDRVCSPETTCTTRYRTEHYTTSEPVYRDDPVYRTWFTWDNWEWAENRRVPASGTTTDTRWPSEDEVAFNKGLQDGEHERSRQEAKYHVTFQYKDEKFEYDPTDINSFQRFPIGSKHKLKVGVAHGIEVLK